MGDLVFALFDKFQEIQEFYPETHGIEFPTMQLKQVYGLMKKRDWGKHLIEKLNKEPSPLVTTFSTVAFMAEHWGYQGDIWLVITDTDVARAWAPLRPNMTRIRYCASTEVAAQRLERYGVPHHHIFQTGFPLPEENIGGNSLKTVKSDLVERVINLDPNHYYRQKYGSTVKQFLQDIKLEEKHHHPLTLTFAVGGAGAQRQLGCQMLASLKSKLLKKEINLNLIASSRNDVYLYFKNNWLKPALTAIASVPTSATEIEQKAVEEALYKAGFSQVFLIEKPLATAAGCRINIFSHEPNLIADLGGGLIELSVVGSGGIISQKTLKNAGDQMNKIIYNYVYLKYGVILGEATCEQLKINLLNFNDEEKIAAIRGKSLETGLPKSVKIKTSDIREALLTNFNLIIDNIKELIESSPPEVLDEVMKKGIILTGGMAKIKGINKFIADEIKIDVTFNEDFESSTVHGLMKLRRHEEDFSKLIIR